MTYIPPTPLLASIVAPTSPPPSPPDLLSLVFVRPLPLCQSPFSLLLFPSPLRFLFLFFVFFFPNSLTVSPLLLLLPPLLPLLRLLPRNNGKANSSKRTDLLPNFAPLASYTTYCRSVREVCRLAACLDISTCAILGRGWPFSKSSPRNKSIRQVCGGRLCHLFHY